MTGNLFIDSAISLAAIGVMVLLAWFFFRAPVEPVDEPSARRRLALDEPDFSPAGWFFDEAGRAALAEGSDGSFVLVSQLGDGLVSRRFGVGGARATADAAGLHIHPGDPGSRAVTLAGGEAADWARKIAGN